MPGRNLVHCRLRVRCFGIARAAPRPLGRSNAHRHPVCSLPDRSIGAFAHEFEVPYRIRSSHCHFGVFHFRYLVVKVNHLYAGKAKGPASLICIAGPNAWEESKALSDFPPGRKPGIGFPRGDQDAARSCATWWLPSWLATGQSSAACARGRASADLAWLSVDSSLLASSSPLRCSRPARERARRRSPRRQGRKLPD